MEENIEITTLESLSEENIVPNELGSADGNGAVSEQVTSPNKDNVLSLEEINSFLGKNFTDKATALKALKDTQSFVGKRKEDFASELQQASQQTAEELRQIKEEMFYQKHPEYAPYKDTIKAMGNNPAEVVENPAFKSLFEKARGFDESQSLKSVLESNPRVVASQDKLSKAREAVASGRFENAETLAAQAVLETLG